MRNISLNLLVWASLAASSSFGANLVTNSDFSNGLNSWTNNDNVEWGWASAGSQGAKNGCESIDCVNQNHLETASYLYQNLSTHAGDTYNLVFDFGSGIGVPSELKVLWGGNVVLDLVDAAANQYSVSNLVATSNSMQLMFLGRQEPDFLFLNHVDVEQASAAAPEPASIGLICGGIGLFGFAQQLRRRRASRS